MLQGMNGLHQSEFIGIMFHFWEWIKTFLNSAFFTAGFGALAGAYFAQRIAERAAQKNELTREIRDTNAATSITYKIWNSLIEVKKNITPQRRYFLSKRNKIIQAKEENQHGELSSPIEAYVDLRALTTPTFPIEIFEKRMFESLSLQGRPLIAAGALIESLYNLCITNENRNDLIKEFKGKISRPDGISQELYFGLPASNGDVDSRYKDLLDGLFQSADEGMYFCQLLFGDLQKHGRKLIAEYKSQYRSKAPKLVTIDFNQVDDLSWLPNTNNYKSWEENIAKDDVNDE